jgi:hypothetical protein
VPPYTTYNGDAAGKREQVYIDNPGDGGTYETPIYLVVNSGNTAPKDGTGITLNVIDTAGSSVSRTVVVKATPKLHVELSTDQGAVLSDGVGAFTYTVAYSTEQAALTGGVLTVPVPAGATFVSADGGGTMSNGIVTWALGAIPQDVNGQVHVSFGCNGGGGGLLLVEAELTDGNGDLAKASDARVLEPEPSFTSDGTPPSVYTLTTPNDPAAPGQTIEYDITESNLGTPRSNYYVYFTVPPYTTYDGDAPGKREQVYISNTGAGQTCTAQVHLQVNSGNASPPDGTGITLNVMESSGVSVSRTVVVKKATQPLNLQLSTDAGNVAQSGTFTYTLSYSTPGQSALAGGTLTLPVPAGTNFVSADGGGTMSNGTISWALGTIQPKVNGQVHVTLAENGTNANGGLLLLEAALTDSAGDVARASDTRVVEDVPESVYTLTTPDDPVQPGGVIEYDLTASNLGTPRSAYDVHFTVPPHTTYGNDGAGTSEEVYINNTGAGAVLIRQIYLNVTSGNTAPPDGTGITLNMIDDVGSAVSRTVVVESAPKLNLQLSTNQGNVAQSGTFTYTLACSTPGGSTLGGGMLSLPVPAGATFVSADGGGVLTNGTVQWALGAIAPGVNERAHVTFVENGTDQNGGLLLIEPTLSDTTGDVARASDTRVVSNSPESIYTLTAPNDPVQPGQELEYDLTASNLGASRNSYSVYFTVPPYTTCGGDPAGTSESVEIRNTGVGNTSIVPIYLNVTTGNVAPPDGTPITLNVVDEMGSSVSRMTTAAATPALGLQLACNQSNVSPGGNFTYTLTYYGAGAGSVPGGVLTVPVPDGTTFSSADGGGVEQNGVVTWPLGTVISGSSGQVHLTLQAGNGLLAGQLLLIQAALTDEAGDTALASDTRVVSANPAAVYGLSTSQTSVAAGDTLTLMLTATNVGNGSYGPDLRYTVPRYTEAPYYNTGSEASANIGTLETGGTAGVTLSLAVSGSAPAGTPITVDVIDEDGASVSYTVPVQSSTTPAMFAVTPVAGSNGAISPQTLQTVASGGSVMFTATPDNGYVVNDWLVDGDVAQTGGTSFALSNVQGPHTVTVNFMLKGAGTFYFPQTTALAPNTAGTVTLEVSRDFGGAGSVGFQTVDSTAKSGVEYTGTSGTLNFAVNQTVGSITVPILPDGSAPGTSYFAVELTNPSAGNAIGSSGSAGVIILNEILGDVSISKTPGTAPQGAPAATGSITVNLSALPANGQWRLLGELDWRNGGTTATGLTMGNYEIEYKPVNGYEQPGLQVVPLFAGELAVETGSYTQQGTVGTGSLTVTLSPAGTGGWRFQGETAWRMSGTVGGLNAGDYLLEFEPETGLATPTNVQAEVDAGENTQVNETYLIGDSATGLTPVEVTSTDARTGPAYDYTGLIQTNEGVGSGFVPLDRVVVTAAHVLFDDATLSYVPGVQWYYQYAAGRFETPPEAPAGSYMLNGYAAQRALDDTPGVASAASRQLDAAVLYFLAPAARGGASGYLASNATTNAWLTGYAEKYIAGYPMAGVSPTGYLYATPAVTSAFTNVAGSLFSTTAVTSYPGNSGGPVFVQYSDGSYYPAAIYLGGSDETEVHAIDSAIIDLMNRGELSGNGGANNNSGGALDVVTPNAPVFELGSLTVNLTPAAAVTDGAYWELAGDDVMRQSGQSLTSIAPGTYTVQFFTNGQMYSPPANMLVTVASGGVTSVSGSYTENLPGHPEGTYLSLLQGGSYGTSGYLEMGVTKTGAFTLTLNVGGKTGKVKHSLTIQNASVSTYSGTIVVPHGPSYMADLALSSGAVLSGTLTEENGGGATVINARRMGTTIGGEVKGSYTAVLPAPTGTTGLPGGNGYGTFTVSKTGGVKFTGMLGDGVAVRASGALDAEGVWTFVFEKPAGKTTGAELLLGTVAFPLASNGAAGTLQWYRTGNVKDAVYPNGFAAPVTVLAGGYAQPVVSYGTGSVIFTGADTGGSIVKGISIDGRGRVTYGGTDRFSMKFTPGTGAFSGSFMDHATPRTFSGAVLQGQKLGLGLFQAGKAGASATGAVILQGM